ATALAWTFERLLRTPDVHERAIAAAREGDDAYLDAVAQEALRVRPVIFDVVRKPNRPAAIAGLDLPAGVLVAPGIRLVPRGARPGGCAGGLTGYPAAMLPWRAPLGAAPRPDGTVEFRVWAQRAERVAVRVRDTDHELADAGLGVREGVVTAAPGDDYWFVLD